MTITKRKLIDLIKQDGDTFVSIYLPMHRTGRERQQNRIRFKNLVDDAQEFLAHEPNTDEAAEVLGALHRLRDDQEHDAWEHPGEGLAVLGTRQGLHVFALPIAVKEQMHIGERFYLKPLLQIAQDEGRYLALAVSQKRVRIFEGSSDTLSELHPKHLPKDLEDALNIDEYVSSLQYHSMSRDGSPDVMYHGHGAGEDDHKQELLQYFHRLDDALGKFLRDEDAPLVFVGVDYLFPIFKEGISYRNLLNRPVEGNFDDASPGNLRKAIWEVVQPYFKERVDSAVSAFQDACGQDRTCSGPQAVLLAATRGAVDSLLIRGGASCWGQMDTEGNVVCHDDPTETSLDLLDEAAYETLGNSGQVLIVDDAEFPVADTPCVALLRYPVGAATAS